MVEPIPVTGQRPYTSDMPPERFDWSERQPSQAAPSSGGYAPAGPAPAGLAQAGPPATPGSPPVNGPPPTGGSAASALVVRTQRSEHTMQPGTVYRVGRDPKSDISMTDSRVSWQHGVFKVAGDKWVFEDVGSTNGTFLGQQKVDRVEISAECAVHLGNPDDGTALCAPGGTGRAQHRHRTGRAHRARCPRSFGRPRRTPDPRRAHPANPLGRGCRRFALVVRVFGRIRGTLSRPAAPARRSAAQPRPLARGRPAARAGPRRTAVRAPGSSSVRATGSVSVRTPGRTAVRTPGRTSGRISCCPRAQPAERRPAPDVADAAAHQVPAHRPGPR
jgi:hypothetical protein